MINPRPVVIVTGGDAVSVDVGAALPSPAVVIAADSGIHSAMALGLPIDLIVGDMDSANGDSVDEAIAAGAEIEKHPADKDATDLELALEAALSRGLGPAIVIGGASVDRIDHFLANALLLTSDRFRALEAQWWVKGARVHVVGDTTTLTGSEGDTVTLLPVGGRATGVVTSGLRWGLDGETLEPGTTRGVSNELTGPTARIEVDKGTLLVIQGGPA